MEQSLKTLPQISELSPSVVSFLNEKFNTKEDLRKASSLVSELKSRCCQLDETLSDLNRRLGACVLAYSSHSDRIGGLFGVINTKLSDLSSLSSGSRSLLGIGCLLLLLLLWFWSGRVLNLNCLLYCFQMEEREKGLEELSRVWLRSFQLWQRKLLVWRLFGHMPVSFELALIAWTALSKNFT